MTSEKVIQSYVLERWFVSTIRRNCSAPEAYDALYCETMVWEWDPETRKVGRLIGQDETCSSDECGVRRHMEVCVSLIENDGWVEEAT